MKRSKACPNSGWWWLILIGACLLEAGAIQAGSSESIVIRGVVPPIEEIKIEPVAGHDQLNLSEGVQDLKVAVINERSNAAGGFTVTLSSQNGTKSSDGTAILKGAGNAANTVSYRVKYGPPGQEEFVQFQSGSALVSEVARKTVAEGVTKNLIISVEGGSYAADTYEDVLVLTLQNR